MEKVVPAIVIVVTFVTLVIVIALLFSFPAMWLWNWLMPDLFGVKEVTFWQALGLLLLSGLLFKSGHSCKRDRP